MKLTSKAFSEAIIGKLIQFPTWEMQFMLDAEPVVAQFPELAAFHSADAVASPVQVGAALLELGLEFLERGGWKLRWRWGLGWRELDNVSLACSCWVAINSRESWRLDHWAGGIWATY